jgi:hypothetical protein
LVLTTGLSWFGNPPKLQNILQLKRFKLILEPRLNRERLISNITNRYLSLGEQKMLGPGDTFILPKSAKQIEHLWIVLTPAREDGKAVCVNVTSWKFECDQTVILGPGDHAFITKKSVIHFEDARFVQMEHVERLLTGGTDQFVCRRNYCCTHVLMDRIKDGLLKSKRTPNGIKEHCRALWKPEMDERAS